MMQRLMRLMHGVAPAQQLARGSLISFIIQGAGAGLIFFSEVVLARALSAHGYGLYATVIAWLQVLAMVALLGSNHLLLRFVPTYVATQEWSLLRGLLRLCNRGALLISALIFTLAVLMFTVLSERVSPELRWAFLIGIAALPVYALSMQRQSILRGFQRIFTALMPDHVVRPLLLILLIMGIGWSNEEPISAFSALIMNGMAITMAFSLGWYWMILAIPEDMRMATPVMQSVAWMHVALPLFFIAGMQLLITRMDILMLGVMTGGEQAGMYAAASRVSDLVVFALAAANSIVAPMIAGLYARGDMQALQSVMTVLAKGIVLITLPVVLIVWGFGDSILNLFGVGYGGGYMVLSILVCGQIVNALSGPVGFLMVMTGHQQQSMYIFFLATVLNLVLNLLFIPAYGIVGAAVATATTTALWNFLMLRFIRKNLNIDSSFMAIFRNRL